MAKKPTSRQDTTKVAPRYVITKSEQKSIKNLGTYDRLNDTTRAKNVANVQANSSLIQRNAERVREGQKPLPKPAPTLYAKSLPAKKKK